MCFAPWFSIWKRSGWASIIFTVSPLRLQPAGGDEDGGRDVVGDERLEDALVRLAAAGIERQRHVRLLVGGGMRQDQPGLAQGGPQPAPGRPQDAGENQSGEDDMRDSWPHLHPHRVTGKAGPGRCGPSPRPQGAKFAIAPGGPPLYIWPIPNKLS